MAERGYREGPQQPLTWRTKGGLETPLLGRIYGENKRLTFAPPYWYDALVVACVFGGFFALLGAFGLVHIGIFNGYEEILQFAGFAVMLAGIWGAASNERMACDLRNGTYARLEGQGFRKRVTRGSLSELQAIVLMSQEIPIPVLGGRPVVYRLVLYWKHSKEPLLIIGRDERQVPMGQPLNAGAGPIAYNGQRYAQALGIPFYDNSYMNSAGPLSVV